MRGKNKRFRQKNFQTILFLVIIALFAIFFFATKKPISIESEILEKVKNSPEVQDYKNYPANVTFLTKDKLTQLAKDYPIIYGNITIDVYEIRFLSDSKGLLVLYDANQNKIIRVFEIIGVKIG